MREGHLVLVARALASQGLCSSVSPPVAAARAVALAASADAHGGHAGDHADAEDAASEPPTSEPGEAANDREVPNGPSNGPAGSTADATAADAAAAAAAAQSPPLPPPLPPLLRGPSTRSLMRVPTDAAWRGELIIDGFDDLWQRCVPLLRSEWHEAVRRAAFLVAVIVLVGTCCPSALETITLCPAMQSFLPFLAARQAAFRGLHRADRAAALRKGPLSAFAHAAKPAGAAAFVATTAFELWGKLDAVLARG
jgi:hypothetical protein